MLMAFPTGLLGQKELEFNTSMSQVAIALSARILEYRHSGAELNLNHRLELSLAMLSEANSQRTYIPMSTN